MHERICNWRSSSGSASSGADASVAGGVDLDDLDQDARAPVEVVVADDELLVL